MIELRFIYPKDRWQEANFIYYLNYTNLQKIKAETYANNFCYITISLFQSLRPTTYNKKYFIRVVT